MKIEFFIPMIPPTRTAQQKRKTSKGFYDDAELKQAKAKLRDHLIPYVPEQPLDGPLRLIVKWLFPLKKGTQHGQYKCTKPDTDNLNKALKDEMEKLGFFVNDSRVASEVIEKFWAVTPGIYVRIETIEEV